MPFNIKERWENYTEPFQILCHAFYGLWNQSRRSDHDGASSAQDRAFAQWYTKLAPDFFEYENTTTLPYLVSAAQGTVLELGPGTGNRFPRYDLNKINHIYGVEPNVAFAETLNEKITKANLDDKYTLVFCRIEDTKILEAHGIQMGSIDCITSFQVLCSVDKPAEVVAQLWNLLKPGAELIFWEHDASTDWLTWVVQKSYSLLWPAALSGCRLDRPINDILLKSASWEVIELKHEGEDFAIMPRGWGRLRKVENTGQA